jgi:exosortase E/protease (VPEID-CTERM system)
MPVHLLGRIYLLFALVVIEYLYCFNGRGEIPGHLKFSGTYSDPYGLIPIFTYLIFVSLGYFKLKALKDEIPFDRNLFVLHILCIVVVFSLTIAARQGGGLLLFDPSSYIKSAFYLLATVLLVLAYVPLRIWFKAFQATGRLWLYAPLAGMAGWYVCLQIKLLWIATSTVQSGWMQRITLYLVSAVLGHFVPDLFVDSTQFMVGTPRYSFIIGGGCSGVEGLGLVLIFTSLWLWYFRKETRFPHALLLIPCALICSWLLNIVRLCALVVLGNAGWSEIGDIGFHSQFGWIAFTAVALAFSMATQKLSWLRKKAILSGSQPPIGEIIAAETAENAGERPGESPAIRAYLLPFLAILAATFISKAASGYFEWLYPLRFVAAALVLWYFLPELKKLNWRFGWLGPVAGAAVFLIWIAPSLGAHQHSASLLGAELAALSPTARWAWIAIRVAAAVITVPIAEELAFRGYLARRLISREFETVSFSSLTVLSICLSSIVFGLEHMKDLKDWQHLILGTLAGLAFAAALRWKGRIGDAVVAHSVSNLLLAAWVLGLGDWTQW